jgi:hypothetical protein
VRRARFSDRSLSRVGSPSRLGAAAGEGPPPPWRRSPWRIVVSTAVTVVVLLVVFVPQVLLGVLTFPWWRLTAARRRGA